MTEGEKIKRKVELGIGTVPVDTRFVFVTYIGAAETLAFERNKKYEVISNENGWYRIITEIQEDYLFSPSEFKIVN